MNACKAVGRILLNMHKERWLTVKKQMTYFLKYLSSNKQSKWSNTGQQTACDTISSPKKTRLLLLVNAHTRRFFKK